MLGGMNDRSPSHFEQLLQHAASQPQPQRLLFVFAAAELPPDASPEQRKRYAAGGGGALAPLMCVDKAPRDLPGFDALVAESRDAGPPWDVVFVAGLDGRDGRSPTDEQVEQALHKMVNAVHTGMVRGFAAYDGGGRELLFE
jgi:hypothetical protein